MSSDRHQSKRVTFLYHEIAFTEVNYLKIVYISWHSDYTYDFLKGFWELKMSNEWETKLMGRLPKSPIAHEIEPHQCGQSI